MGALLQTDRAISAEDEHEVRAIEHLRHALVDREGSIRFIAADGQEVEVPPSIQRLLQQVTPLLAEGGAMVWLSASEELTAQQAAAFLDLPEPFVHRILEDGELPASGVQQRIRVADLLLWRERWETERRQLLTDMLQQAQDAGAYR